MDGTQAEEKWQRGQRVCCNMSKVSNWDTGDNIYSVSHWNTLNLLKKHFKSGKSFRDCIHRPFTFPSLSNLACFTQLLAPSPQTRGGFYYPAITRNSKCQCNNWFCSQLCLKIVLHWFLKMKLLESQCRVIFHCQLCNDLMTLYFCKSSLQDESSTSTANFHCLLIDLGSSCHRKEKSWAIVNLKMVGQSGEWVRLDPGWPWQLQQYLVNRFNILLFHVSANFPHHGKSLFTWNLN